MDDNRLHKLYRGQGFSWKTLVYHYLITDSYFRSLFNFGPYCGAITGITCLLLILVLTYTFNSWSMFRRNIKKFNELSYDADKRLPRKESVLQVAPAYNCINKHLQQADVFLDKTKKVIRKEQLEVELMNSRINCITELLNTRELPQERTSKSSGNYYREHSSLKKAM